MLLYAAAALMLAAEPKVTLSDPGAAVPQLVQEISQSSGIPLFAPKAFETDILAVRLQDAPLKDVLDRIADLTAGDWQPKGDGFELTRSHAKQVAEEQADRQRELEMFAKAIADQKKRLANLGAWNEGTVQSLAEQVENAQKTQPQNGVFDSRSWQRIQELDSQAPGGRALSRIVASLDPEMLANLPPDYRIAFSDKPTRLQRPLPNGAIGGVSCLVDEQNLWADVAARLFTDQQGGGLYSAARFMTSPFDGRLGKVLILVTKNKSMGYLGASIELLAANQKGVIVVRGNQSLSTRDFQGYQPPKAEPGEQPIEPSDFAKAIGDAFKAGGQDPAGIRLPAQIREELLDPEHREPLSFAAGDTLVRIADGKKENLIASLPDESFFLGAAIAMQKMTPSMLLKSLNWMGMNLTDANGWLVIRPESPAKVREQRLDRAALGRYLRVIAKRRHAGLDELASYAMNVQGELFNSLGYQVGRLVAPRQTDEYYDVNALRLYGMLDPFQRLALSRGGAIRFGNLTQAQRAVVDKMVFGPNPNLSPIQQEIPLDGGAVAVTNDTDLESFWNGIRREPTEMFGDGIPPDSVVKMAEQTDRVLIAQPFQSANGLMRFGNQALTPDDLAERLLAKERPGIMPWIDDQAQGETGKYNLGNRRMVTLTLEFGKLAQTQYQLQDMGFDDTSAITLDQAPEDFRKAVQEKLVALRKAYADVKPGDFGSQFGGRSNPPPPR